MIDNGVLLCGSLLEILCFRNCSSRYKEIRGYLLFCLIRSLLLICLRPWPLSYYWGYWSLQLVSLVLQGLILGAFSKEAGLPLWPTLFVMGLVVFMPQASFSSVFVSVLISCQRAVYTGRFLVWAVIWLKESELSLLSRRLVNAFGLLAGCELVLAWVKSHFGLFNIVAFNRVGICFFLAMIWLWWLAFKEDSLRQSGQRIHFYNH